mmetsp:Transcript_10910/g.26745  ORF Transcript_10910/g.26745 Transcript_10910/m.26745 type:complete len:433 (-) Transcript_10910:677-1975(-)|eukprot:CAMPEP_0114494098 /NCGR_PEP_ID=MMETSP0109-20121206/4467_1 /TAXON_ID=29199 /ORGANISM="Chlorarachnion reptans, Strain CCCM449" /LENGTH=432 /DNA_ID=CAMNT_0001671105 /DNA_START=280 /DNA_END=1578 /DNA_ORIENTATION=+
MFVINVLLMLATLSLSLNSEVFCVRLSTCTTMVSLLPTLRASKTILRTKPNRQFSQSLLAPLTPSSSKSLTPLSTTKISSSHTRIISGAGTGPSDDDDAGHPDNGHRRQIRGFERSDTDDGESDDCEESPRISTNLDELDVILLSIAVPALFALASDPVASLVDTAFVGRLGPEPLASTGLAAAILNLSSKIVSTPLVSVTTTQVASAKGKDELSDASTAALEVGIIAGLAQSLLLLLLSAPLAVIVAGGGHEVLGSGVVNIKAESLNFLRYLLNPDESTLADATRDILQIRALATPAIAVGLAVQGVYRGMGDTKTPLFATVGCNLLNLALAYAFLFQFKLGAQGAALATTLSECTASGVLLYLVANQISLTPNFGLDSIGVVARRLAGDTLLLSFRSAVVWLTFTLASGLTARIDNDASAAYQVPLVLII